MSTDPPEKRMGYVDLALKVGETHSDVRNIKESVEKLTKAHIETNKKVNKIQRKVTYYATIGGMIGGMLATFGKWWYGGIS